MTGRHSSHFRASFRPRALMLRSLIFAVAVLLSHAYAGGIQAQTALRWQQITDGLLTQDSVNLSGVSPNCLRRLYFIDDTSGFISTCLGDVIRTDDGGATWHTVYRDLNQRGGHFLGEYLFLDGNTWFTFPSQGGTMWSRTTDGGKQWETFKNPTCPYITPFLITADAGWGVSGSSVCATNDGGRSWSIVDHVSGVRELDSIFMLDNTHGWVSGNGQVLATVDGTHWFAQFQSVTTGVMEMRFLDRNHGYMRLRAMHPRSEQGDEIMYTVDGGRRWAPSTWNISSWSDSRPILSNCAIQQGQEIWVIRYSFKPGTTGLNRPTSQAIVFRSRDAGTHFESVGKLPDGISWPKSVAVATQQDKPVLLMIDSSGALWRTILPTN
jgi:photosystem II stability/assembly factor-like uncharacterized protein